MSRPPSTPALAADHNLLFGVLALHLDLITREQFVEACSLWVARKDVPLAYLLLERGWIAAGDRDDVERLLQRKVARAHAAVGAGLAAALDERTRAAVREIPDEEVRGSLDGLPPAEGPPAPLTVAHVPAQRNRYR